MSSAMVSDGEIRHWRPLPMLAYPKVLRPLLAEFSSSLRIDPAAFGVPLLAVLSGCVGNRRSLAMKNDQTAPGILWAVLVGKSGSMKSPVFRQLTDCLSYRDAVLYKRYERDLARWQEDSRANRSLAGNEPKKPPTTVVNDVTTEAMISVLEHSPLGLLYLRDELSGWFASFDAYRSRGKGLDESVWNQSYEAGSVKYERKGSRTISVPRCSVSVMGAIQPKLAGALITASMKASGFLPRILWACPPQPGKSIWSPEGVSPVRSAQYAELLDQLLQLEPDWEEPGVPKPRLVEMSPDALAVWMAWRNGESADRQAMAPEYEAAVISKIWAAVPRIALLWYLVEQATGEIGYDEAMPGDCMEKACLLGDWLFYEKMRVETAMSNEGCSDEIDALREIADANGGRIKCWRVVRKKGLGHRFRRADEARIWIDSLSASGILRRVSENGEEWWEIVSPDGVAVDAAAAHAEQVLASAFGL